MREIVIGGAQMGPIQKADSREAVVARMMALLDQAIAAKCDLVVFPELTLTTFFPRWMMEDQAEVDTWFEAAMPNPPNQPNQPNHPNQPNKPNQWTWTPKTNVQFMS